jgi:methanogenic corrinoid protein MtbC1
VSKSLLYWYWDGKAALLAELIDTCLEAYKALFREALAGEGLFGDRLQEALWEYVSLFRKQDRLNKLVHFCSLHHDKFEAGEYYLPQLVAAGEMFKTVSARLRGSDRSGDGSPLAQEPPPQQGDIVLGTPLGDIHDLGKNIFSILAQASGFTVHDLGVDVPPAAFMDKLVETGATVLGMSALLTTTFDAIQSVVALLEEGGLRRQTYVIIGGGATEASLVEKLGVDAQTWDAYTGVKRIRAFVERGRREAAA